MVRHAYVTGRMRRWLALASAACVGACVGTPTPEPPDWLPTPDESIIFGREIAPMVATTSALVPLHGGAGAVTPNSDLWIVNLDDENSAPSTVRARGNGSFSAMVDARQGDRIRLVSRTARQHSLPLDALYQSFGQRSVSVSRLPPESLACLELEPAAGDITRVVAADESSSQSFTLRNRCSDSVLIDRASLRFGDQGFTLARPPESIPANGEVALSVIFAGHVDPSEHADIVLLDVSTVAQDSSQGGTTRGRYALGVWSVSATGSGND